MDTNATEAGSHLYLVRLWPEDANEGKLEWRGKVQHVLNTEAHYFKDWTELVALLQTMLPATESTPEKD